MTREAHPYDCICFECGPLTDAEVHVYALKSAHASSCIRLWNKRYRVVIDLLGYELVEPNDPRYSDPRGTERIMPHAVPFEDGMWEFGSFLAKKEVV